jgi:hypothetical protein
MNGCGMRGVIACVKTFSRRKVSDANSNFYAAKYFLGGNLLTYGAIFLFLGRFRNHLGSKLAVFVSVNSELFFFFSPKKMSSQHRVETLYEGLMKAFVGVLGSSALLDRLQEEERIILTSFLSAADMNQGLPPASSRESMPNILAALVKSDLDSLFIYDVDHGAYAVQYTSCYQNKVILSSELLQSWKELWTSEVKDRLGAMSEITNSMTTPAAPFILHGPDIQQEHTSEYWYSSPYPFTLETLIDCNVGVEVDIVPLKRLHDKEITPKQNYGNCVYQFDTFIDLTDDNDDGGRLESPLDPYVVTVKQPCMTIGTSTLFRVRFSGNSDPKSYAVILAEGTSFSHQFSSSGRNTSSPLTKWRPHTPFEKWMQHMFSFPLPTCNRREMNSSPKRSRNQQEQEEQKEDDVENDDETQKTTKRMRLTEENETEDHAKEKDHFFIPTPTLSSQNDNEKETTKKPTLIGSGTDNHSEPTSSSAVTNALQSYNNWVIFSCSTFSNRLSYVGESQFGKGHQKDDDETESESDDNDNDNAGVTSTAVPRA